MTHAQHGATDPASVLCDPGRARVLGRIGLGAETDSRCDDLAAWVTEALDVPVALVSLVREDEQVFPGMTGLPEPWAAKRATPLSHSFCQHVVITAAPLVVTDAREDPLVRDNLAIPDLGVVAYAGMPLTDTDGTVLGSLCAIDTRTRHWTDAELGILERIAAAASAELRLRLARYDTDRELDRRDAVEAAHLRALDRSHILLTAARAFGDATTVADALTRLAELLDAEFTPTLLLPVLVEGDRLHRLGDAGDPHPARFARHDATPAATAIREGRLVHHPDRASFETRYSAAVIETFRRLDLQTCVAVPLLDAGGPCGAVVLAWDRPDAVEPGDLLTLASVAGYAGQAIGRAGLLEHRIAVAHALQNAMLSPLPQVDDLQMARRYSPADARENVGGDWYDAAPLIDHPDGPGRRRLMVSVGDIVGHTLDAATHMGQIRSMLRQAAWDHLGEPPSVALRAVDDLNRGLGLGAAGSAVVGYLEEPSPGRWSLTWTNAGHPPPVLLAPDGTVELLDEHDTLFGFAALAELPRTDHTRAVPPGATLFLYTDGLVEHGGGSIDEGIADLLALLRRHHGLPVRDLVDTVVDMLAPEVPDDVVAFAVRFPVRTDSGA